MDIHVNSIFSQMPRTEIFVERYDINQKIQKRLTVLNATVRVHRAMATNLA